MAKDRARAKLKKLARIEAKQAKRLLSKHSNKLSDGQPSPFVI